ncbi:hypothetical protein [Luteibacter sp. ME-Dv--P-043b]|uniref:hypothetical protein n=1 Tax=unclassified Luteibacter TaxID=2620188 RepID=UPI00255396D0|nr:hypothetical protein [Luteibacter sp. ME-Dv--P-043b]
MLQLNPPLPMNTPKGEGFAHFLIDYGPESDLYWTVFITATGEIWTFANREVRASKNITIGRTAPTAPTPRQAPPARRPAEAREPGVLPFAVADAPV